jgi:nickel-dependent lactate racemase
MLVRLDYGRSGLEISLPDSLRVEIAEPSQCPPVADPIRSIRDALAAPLAAAPLARLAHGRSTAVVVVADKTRPVPYPVLLPPLLETLAGEGLTPEKIEILVATGLHRANTPAELHEMLGGDVVGRYRVRNHVARDTAAHVHLGRTQRGTEVWIDRGFLAADLKITAGLIEPHLMAGYSGGRKMVCPGLAGVETMRSAHGPRMLEDRVGPGIVDGNPFHEDLIEVARMAGVDFMCDVAIDRSRRITGVFAGDIVAAHAAGMQAVEAHVRVDLDGAADIVVTSAGGYPLDQTFYQSIKGLTGALNVVRRGGTIILAAEMAEGMGSAEFQELLRSVKSNAEYMERIRAADFFRIDQWMVQHLCQVTRKAEVLVVSSGFRPGAMGNLPVRSSASVDAALREAMLRHGPNARITVIPHGPYVLATVRGRKLALGTAWLDQAA